MNFLRDIVYGTIFVIVTLLIFTVMWITYIILSPLHAIAKTTECWNSSLFEVKRRKM